MSQTQIVSDFVVRAREYVLLNSSEEEIKFMAGGEQIVVPGSKTALGPHPIATHARHSLFLDGELVPGTLVLHDIMVRDETGEGSEAIWNAGHAVRLVLGISTLTGEASSGYSRRGLSLLPSNATREDIEELRAAGRERMKGWQLEQAEIVVRAHDEKNEVRRRMNVPMEPGGRDYVRAAHLLSAATEADRQQAKEFLDVQDKTEADDLGELLKEKLKEIVTERRSLTSSEVVDQLLADPKALALLKETHKIRKLRGPNVAKKAGPGDDGSDG